MQSIFYGMPTEKCPPDFREPWDHSNKNHLRPQKPNNLPIRHWPTIIYITYDPMEVIDLQFFIWVNFDHDLRPQDQKAAL